MRNIIAILLFLAPVLSNGQNLTPQGTVNGGTRQRGGFAVDSMIRIPDTKDTTAWFGVQGNLAIRPQDGKLYYRSNGSWKSVDNGGGGNDTAKNVFTGTLSQSRALTSTPDLIVTTDYGSGTWIKNDTVTVDNTGTQIITAGGQGYSRVYEMLMPEYWGAKGDGSTNDYTALLAAINYGKPLTLNGTYKTSSIFVNNKSVDISGSGIIVADSNIASHVLVFDNCDGLRMSGITINGRKDLQSKTSCGLVLQNLENFELSDISVINAWAGIYDDTAALSINNCKTGLILNSSVYFSKYNGLSINEGSRDVDVYGGFYSYNGYSGVQTREAKRVNIIGVKADSNGTSNITINGYDNEVTNCVGSNSLGAHGLNIGHPGADFRVLNCTVTGGSYFGNKIWGVAIYGDSLTRQSNIVLQGVKSYSNIELGAWIQYAENVNISNCQFTNNTIDGIQVLNTRGININNTLVTGNTRYNIWLRAGTTGAKLFNSSYSQQNIDGSIPASEYIIENQNPNNYIGNQSSIAETKNFWINGNAIAGKMMVGVTSTFGGLHVKNSSGAIIEAGGTNDQLRLSQSGTASIVNAHNGNLNFQSLDTTRAALSRTTFSLITGMRHFIGSDELYPVYKNTTSPEGVITSLPGATYLNTVTGDLYYKRSGIGNTGWVLLMSSLNTYSRTQSDSINALNEKIANKVNTVGTSTTQYVSALGIRNYVDTTIGTGWGSYTDTLFKVATPFAIANGTTDTLENGGQSTTLTQLPLGVSAFYNPVTKKFIANKLGDAYTISVRFKAKNSATNGYFTATFDVGGVLAFSVSDTKTFAKGAGVEHSFVLDYNLFAGALWVANGGTLKITADSGNLQIYDINYLITRTHKGR